MIPRLLASTTSHKGEPLLPTLEILSRLGLHDIDLNLHHILELGVNVGAIRRAATAGALRIWVLSGGWCDFYAPQPAVEETFRSVDRQVAIAAEFGVDMLRLFFGRLKFANYDPARRAILCDNMRRLGDRHPAMRFVFENHDGASLHPDVCRDAIEQVDRPNVRMNFDPINFERAGVDSLHALTVVRPVIGHVHLKGLEDGEYCEFGTGDVDLTPMLRSLVAEGFTGSFSVEYEGPFDKTLRLYQSVQRARAALAALDV